MTSIKLLSMATILFVACSFQPKKEKMEKVKIIYVYDALCGWCFGFSPTMAVLKEHYKDKVNFEIVSGGLIVGVRIGLIGEVAPYISKAYKDVENATGVKFGAKFLDGTLKEGKAIFSSIPPAIALSIMKEKYPEKSFEFASLLHQLIYVDGVEQKESYGTYASTLGYDKDEFNLKMKDNVYIQKAYKDFEYAKQLGVNSFPTIILEKDGKREIIFNGCLQFDRAKNLIDSKL